MAFPDATQKRFSGGNSGPNHRETQTQRDRTRCNRCRDLYNLLAGSLHSVVEMHGVSTQKGKKEANLKGVQWNICMSWADDLHCSVGLKMSSINPVSGQKTN